MAPETISPFVRGFQEDVFLSYGHIDNTEGWVDDLHVRLLNRVRQLLGTGEDTVRFWRDPKLHGGDAIWETIEPRVAGSAVFVAICSPRYFKSDGCRREAKRFHQEAAQGAGLLAGATCRAMRVVKTPYDGQALPEFFKEIEAIEVRFFQRNPADETQVSEFPSRNGLPGYSDFHTQANALAASLAGLLQKLNALPGRSEAPVILPKVFLSETTDDRKEDRNFIINEIKGRCNLVCQENPHRPVEQLEADLARQLRDCALSVHILGRRFGLQPEGEETRSLPEIQFDLAEVTRRLVWMPDDVDVEPRQRKFRDKITAISKGGLERMTAPDKQLFVQHLRDVLKELSQLVRKPFLGKAVYVVSNAQDLARPQLKALRNCLLSQGFRVEQPAFEGDIEELRRLEEQALQDTNAAIIYYGEARDAWVRARRMEILKALGTLRDKSAYRRAVYLDAPKTQPKAGVYMDLPAGQLPEAGVSPLLVLGDAEEFRCGKLDPLLRGLAEGTL